MRRMSFVGALRIVLGGGSEPCALALAVAALKAV
jgi:hypothetical protein